MNENTMANNDPLMDKLMAAGAKLADKLTMNAALEARVLSKGVQILESERRMIPDKKNKRTYLVWTNAVSDLQGNPLNVENPIAEMGVLKDGSDEVTWLPISAQQAARAIALADGDE